MSDFAVKLSAAPIAPAKKLQLALQPYTVDGRGAGGRDANQLRGAGHNHLGNEGDGGRLGARPGHGESQEAEERELATDCAEKRRKAHLLQHRTRNRLRKNRIAKEYVKKHASGAKAQHLFCYAYGMTKVMP